MTDEERAGLLKVAEVLEAKSPWTPLPDYEGDRYTSKAVPLLFNLVVRAGQYECGTVACIGGWLSLHLQGVDISQRLVSLTPKQVDTSDKYVNAFGQAENREGHEPGARAGEALSILFYPPEQDRKGNTILDMETVTPAQAAKAIRNFLESGDPKWAEVV